MGAARRPPSLTGALRRLAAVVVALLVALGCAAEDVRVEVDQARLGHVLLQQDVGTTSHEGRKVILLPFVDGGVRTFVVERDEFTLAPELQEAFPRVASYFGAEIGVQDPMTVTVHFSEALGLHAQFLTAQGEAIALQPEAKYDPKASTSRAAKMVFKKRRSESVARLGCGVGNASSKKGGLRRPRPPSDALPSCSGDLESIGNLVCDPALNNADCAFDAGDCCSVYKTCSDPGDCACVDPDEHTVPHREYRLAITATKSYVDFYNGDTEAIVASYAVVLGRVNRFFMRELSVSFQVIPEVVSLLDRNGTRLSDDSHGAARASPAFIRDVLSDDQYDIGHMFGDYANGMGSLSAVCGEEKAVGGTGVLAFEHGEWVVAHEFGHQLGAHHTFSKCYNSQGWFGTEAGSGKSIMSYGGSCGDQDVDADRDTYFHSFSFAEMSACIKNPLKCGACGTIKPGSGQEAPVALTDLDAETVERETTCRVPVRTPFRLEARRGERSRRLFYSWEQSQLRDASDPNAGINDPQTENTILFSAAFPRRDRPSRTFPRMDMVRRGMDLVDSRERLPDLGRAIPFTMLVRTAYLPEVSIDVYDLGWGESVPEADGFPVPTLGATYAAEAVTVQVVEDEPLRVADVASPVVPGGTLRLEWRGAQHTTERVRILLSLDDGETFPVLLAADVASSDGGADVGVPQLPGCGLGFARVRVESLDAQEGCSFFAINDNSLAVSGCDTTGTTPPPVPDWPLVTITAAPTSPVPVPISLGPESGRFDHADRRGDNARLDEYANGIFREYELAVAEGMLATFTVTDFDTENAYDYVIITEPTGESLWSGTGRIPQSDLPITITGSSNKLHLRWTSDDSVAHSGFIIAYGAAQPRGARAGAAGAEQSAVTLWTGDEGGSEASCTFDASDGKQVLVTLSMFVAEAGNVTFLDGDGMVLHRATALDDVLAFPVASRSGTMVVEASGLAGAEGRLALLFREEQPTPVPTSSPFAPTLPATPTPTTTPTATTSGGGSTGGGGGGGGHPTPNSPRTPAPTTTPVSLEPTPSLSADGVVAVVTSAIIAAILSAGGAVFWTKRSRARKLAVKRSLVGAAAGAAWSDKEPYTVRVYVD